MVKIKKQKINSKKKRGNFSAVTRGKSSIRSAMKPLMGVFILCIIAIALLRLKHMFVGSDYFVVKEIRVELSGEKGLLRDTSLKDGINREIIGENIFFLDLKELKDKIEELYPEFKDVTVRRLLPDKLVVESELREPVAQIHSDRYYLVDKEGVVLSDVKNFPDPNYPIITGIGINLAKIQSSRFSEFKREKLDKALALIMEIRKREQFKGYRLKLVDITDPGNLSFYFDEFNVEIKIGNSDFPERLGVLGTLFGQLGTDISSFKYIDLRFEDPILGPR